MKSIQEFLELYPKKSTKSVYRAGIRAFLKFVYGEGDFEALASRYFQEQRDYLDDLVRFASSLNERPPHTARTYIAAVKEYFLFNRVEFTQRELKHIRLKLPKGNARTVEKDMDGSTIRRILEHSDLKGRALILTLASSGMRIREALQVKVGDVDLGGKPPVIAIRGEYTKSGVQRFAFISKEAAGVLMEWLKVRDEYLTSAENRNKGLLKAGFGNSKRLDDDRLFPFSTQVASQLWETALRRAGLLSIDPGTNRKQLRIHQLRKFFRSQLALGCPVDVVEALMGHEGYLTEAYRRYTKQQMAEEYLKHEHLLYVNMPRDIQEIESEFKSQLQESQKCIASLMAKNKDLEEKVKELEESYKLVKPSDIQLLKSHLPESNPAQD